MDVKPPKTLCKIFLKHSGIWDLEASFTFLVLMYSSHSLCTTEGLMNIAEAWGQCSCRRVIIFDTLEIPSSHQTFQTDALLNKLSSSKPCGHRGNVEHRICWALYYLTLCEYKSIKHKALGHLLAAILIIIFWLQWPHGVGLKWHSSICFTVFVIVHPTMKHALPDLTMQVWWLNWKQYQLSFFIVNQKMALFKMSKIRFLLIK